MRTLNFKSLQIPVIASGHGWLAVDKPAGLTVHNAPGKDLCTIAENYIREKPALFAHICLDPDFGIHPVHRLDKETSGVLMLAANRDIFRFLSSQFDARSVKKHYIAILHGPVDTPQTEDGWGFWEWPLAKEGGGRKNPAGPGPKQECRTRYRVLDRSAHYTLAAIELLTGRKHQIRRHAKLAGHPVAGDDRYGSLRAINFLKTNHGFDRLALHSRSMTILLPNESNPQPIETPDFPVQMRELFEKDRVAEGNSPFPSPDISALGS